MVAAGAEGHVAAVGRWRLFGGGLAAARGFGKTCALSALSRWEGAYGDPAWYGGGLSTGVVGALGIPFGEENAAMAACLGDGMGRIWNMHGI